MTTEVIENVLASRYASQAMRDLWSPRNKVILEREFWIAVLMGQRSQDPNITDEVIEAYRAQVHNVDLESIREREAKSRHDVKARIDEYCALAGYELIHRALTSRDLTDNVEQLQILRALKLVRERLVAVLDRLRLLAETQVEQPVVGRSHNAAAQVTTIGKRFASAGTELLLAYRRLEHMIDTYPMRGIRGPMGTSQDMLDFFGGDAVAMEQLEATIRLQLGFARTLISTGQVYPRSMDFAVVSLLAQIAGGPSSLATTLRLMAGFELATEGFQPGQVGSSAMPHKMNSRTCERICGLNKILHGYVAMVGALSGDQWQEGDVSCSVVRRVALPDAFFAIDGMIESMLTVLDEFGIYTAVIDRELETYLPFLVTTKLLNAMTACGMGREVAHEAIKEHAVAAALARREQGAQETDLFARLAADERVPFSEAELDLMAGEPLELIGDATGQTQRFVELVYLMAASEPELARYTPAPIL